MQGGRPGRPADDLPRRCHAARWRVADTSAFHQPLPVSRIARHDILSKKPARGGMNKKIALWLALIGLLVFAGCADGNSGSNADNPKSGSFYSGVSGGWSHP